MRFSFLFIFTMHYKHSKPDSLFRTRYFTSRALRSSKIHVFTERTKFCLSVLNRWETTLRRWRKPFKESLNVIFTLVSNRFHQSVLPGLDSNHRTTRVQASFSIFFDISVQISSQVVLFIFVWPCLIVQVHVTVVYKGTRNESITGIV